MAEDLRVAHRRVEGLRSRDLGSRTVDQALNHFADHWDYGMARMVKSVEWTAEALRSAGPDLRRRRGGHRLRVAGRRWLSTTRHWGSTPFRVTLGWRSSWPATPGSSVSA